MSPRAQSTRARVQRKSSRQNSNLPKKNITPPPSEHGTEPEDAGNEESDPYLVEDDEKSLHSDALDEDSDPELKPARVNGKRKRLTPVKPRGVKGRNPRKRRKSAHSDEDEEEEDTNLKEGQEIVGRVVEAPKTGRGTYCIHMTIKILSRSPGLPPQSPQVRYLKTRSTSFRSYKNRSATIASGERANSSIGQYLIELGSGLDYTVCSSEYQPTV
jgi:hypothetical protein